MVSGGVINALIAALHGDVCGVRRAAVTLVANESSRQAESVREEEANGAAPRER